MFQVGAAVSVALLGLLAVTLGWAAVQYRQFSAESAQSRNRLPASIGRALPAAPPGALDAPEVTLVRYTAGLSTGGAVLFFTDPKRLMSFLALPPSTHIGSRSLARLDVPTTIAALRASTAVRVDHVALIDRSDVGSLVSGLGGITIANPDVVRETDAAAGGSDTRRPAGRRDRINQLEAVSRRSVAGSNLAGCRRRRLSHDAQTIASKLRTSVSAAGRDAVNQGTRATGV